MKQTGHAPCDGEAGQAAIPLIVALTLFVVACFGLSVDFTELLFHRQAARAAADAACQAGAMDIFESSAVTTANGPGFTAGVASDCISSPSATMCVYAAANGFNGTGLSSTESNSVSWSFPSSVSGATGFGSNPFLRVAISEKVRTIFMALLTGNRYQTLNTTCTCGVVQVKGSAPMVVLHPTMSGSLYNSGGGVIISGGPVRGVQVNSSSATAIVGAALIDTSKGGPQQTGSDVAIAGGPGASPGGGCSLTSGFCGGSTGSWRTSVLPVPDPFAAVPMPSTPVAATASRNVSYGTDNCPDRRGCTEFYPGYYAAGIKLTGSTNTAIFRPGMYYMNGSLSSSATATLRNAKPPGTATTDGVFFYFASGSLSLSGSTGVPDTTNIDNVQSTDLTCNGLAPASALNMPTSLSGNVLIAPCTRDGTYWDAAGDTSDAAGTPGIRGLLMFQAHSNATGAVMTGSGSLAFAGTLYFHASSYADLLKFSGNGSSTTFVIGEIITDQLTFSGNGAVALALNPASSMATPKVAVLQ